MAAGLGTRLAPFTDLLPKPLLPLMSVPMGQFAIDSFRAAGGKNLVVNIHAHASKAEALWRELDLKSVNLKISDETKLLLGSAGGLAKAAPHFDGRPFYLLNGDTTSDLELKALAKTHYEMKRKIGAMVTLAVMKKGREAPYREIKVDSGRITGTGEVVPGKPFFIGVAVIEPEALRLSGGIPLDRPTDFVSQILTPAIKAGVAAAHLTECNWFDVGTPEHWLKTHLDWIESLEAGNMGLSWKRRIESVATRVSPSTWIAKEALKQIPASVSERLRGPVFVGQSEGLAVSRSLLGPGSVYYGLSERFVDRDSPEALEGLISFGGKFFQKAP